jgi:hypothetical protein
MKFWRPFYNFIAKFPHLYLYRITFFINFMFAFLNKFFLQFLMLTGAVLCLSPLPCYDTSRSFIWVAESKSCQGIRGKTATGTATKIIENFPGSLGLTEKRGRIQRCHGNHRNRSRNLANDYLEYLSEYEATCVSQNFHLGFLGFTETISFRPSNCNRRTGFHGNWSNVI